MRWVKVATATGTIVCANMSTPLFSIIVQRICMKLGVAMTHYNGCLSLVLQHRSSFGFGVENVYCLQICPPFKCTVNNKL